MARSFANAKVVSAFVADQISVIAARRGFAAAAAASKGGVASGGARAGGVMGNMSRRMKGEEATKATTSWVPDPVTGNYRPEGHVNEMDAADLRNMLLNHKH